MSFKKLEHTEQHSVWIDDSLGDVIAAVGKTKLEIRKHPEGANDWQEPGDCYLASLHTGLWPDDDELRCLAVGVPPDHPIAAERLPEWRKGITILPAGFGDNRTRSIIVNPDVERIHAPLERVEEPKQDSWELWLVRVDAKLLTKGEEEITEEEQSILVPQHTQGNSVDEAVDYILDARGVSVDDEATDG